MRMPKKHMIVFALLVLLASALVYGKKSTKRDTREPNTSRSAKAPDEYESLMLELNNLQKMNADMVSIGTYGKSDDGRDCVYLRMGTAEKPRILVESGLGAGGKRAVAAAVALLRSMIENRDDRQVKWLLENREVYFIPVVSPDAFVSGVQRRYAFPDGTKTDATTASVKSLVEFANEMKFKAVLSLHSDGTNIAEPTAIRSKDRGAVSKIVEHMSSASGMGVGEKSNRDDANWFYNTGSCSVVMNVGGVAPRAYDAALAFLRESTENEMNPLPIRPIFYQAD